MHHPQHPAVQLMRTARSLYPTARELTFRVTPDGRVFLLFVTDAASEPAEPDPAAALHLPDHGARELQRLAAVHAEAVHGPVRCWPDPLVITG
ncbi:hypothetical protein ACFVXQ_33860 [Kitasatospora sp. NPDC058263]